MSKPALCAAGIVLFMAGLIVGAVATPVGAQQKTALRLNHVQIAVPNLEQSLAFYRNVLGFEVAFRLPTPADGRPATAFVQISRDTFLEVAQAAANAPPGISHVGLQTDDLSATVAQMRRAGVTLDDPRPTNGIGSRLATVYDPHGIRLEINEQPAGSLMRKAIDAWK
jgi:catechol 2,3-dioxygenase-like lactoylglutathione lyase family enzyme